MRKSLKAVLSLALVLALCMGMGMPAEAAKKKTPAAAATVTAPTYPVTINNCLIQAKDVVLTAYGAVQESDDGNYYLFSLEPYEAGIGARTDYCAVTLKGETMQFTTPLNLDTPTSKLYSRFQVAVLKGGQYVSVSNDYYITNPEAVATNSIPIPMGAKKGFTMDVRYPSDIKATGAGYASYELDLARFCVGGGVNYKYNGKSYSFSAGVVSEYDQLCKMVKENGAHLVMVVKNSYNPACLEMIYPTGRVPGYNCYAMNVGDQVGTEKLEALMHFLAERYSNKGNGSIHSWIIGNEVNNNAPWHFAGDMDAATFAELYAKEVRVCYNAIKSANGNAKVYINIDQRWNFVDGAPNQYSGRSVLDSFNASMKRSGDIDWGVSIHPHPLPLNNCQFWNIPPDYVGMKLVDHTENSKFVIPSNIEVFCNYMVRPEMLKADGTPRHTIISEMGFTSANPNFATDEMIQAAAMVYAYKLADKQPIIEAIIIHRQLDHPAEITNDGMAVGLKNPDGSNKFAFSVFTTMDVNPASTDFALPYLGATSWADLGL